MTLVFKVEESLLYFLTYVPRTYVQFVDIILFSNLVYNYRD